MSGYIEGLFLREFNIPKFQGRGFTIRPLNVGISEEIIFLRITTE